jgi:type I restriction enzyme S subunit
MSTTVQSFVLPVRSADPRLIFGESEFTYIDISAVDRDQREIATPQLLTPDVAPSRARQVLAAGDVIVSTVRPNLNTVALVPENLDGAIASTGFCVLRPNQERLDKRFLFHWVSSESTVRRLVQQATGATYPAVSDKVIKSQPFSPPSLSEQQRIATILDTADSLRSKRQEAIRLANDLVNSLFFTTFGDVDSNVHSWDVVRLEELALQVTDGEHQTPRRSEDGIKLLSARNVQNGFLALADVDYVPAEEFERIRRRCEPQRGDVLISCSGTIGRVASVSTDEPMALVRSVALVRPDTRQVLTSFLEHYLRSASMQRRMVAASKSSAQANLFQGPIRALPVLLPPMSLQVEFERRLLSLKSWSRKAAYSAEMILDLGRSLHGKYFGSGATL